MKIARVSRVLLQGLTSDAAFAAVGFLVLGFIVALPIWLFNLVEPRWPPDIPKAARSFKSPLKDWKVNAEKFGQDCSYPDENSKLVNWGVHLGTHTECPAGTKVYAIADGVCIRSDELRAHPIRKQVWGGLIVLAHRLKLNGRNHIIYSVFAHLDKRLVERDEVVRKGELIGEVAKANSAANGWWLKEYLHFGVLVDPEKKLEHPSKGGQRLRGYASDKPPFRLKDWADPEKFCKDPIGAVMQRLKAAKSG